MTFVYAVAVVTAGLRFLSSSSTCDAFIDLFLVCSCSCVGRVCLRDSCLPFLQQVTWGQGLIPWIIGQVSRIDHSLGLGRCFFETLVTGRETET